MLDVTSVKKEVELLTFCVYTISQLSESEITTNVTLRKSPPDTEMLVLPEATKA